MHTIQKTLLLLSLFALPAASFALEGEATDCAQVPRAEVAALLKVDPSTLTMKSSLPAPGHAQCDFVATRHVVGGTDAIIGELSLDLYHMPSPDRARQQLAQLGETSLLVKTADPTDDAIALKETISAADVNRQPGFAVTHQADLAIAQMSGTFMQDRPADWGLRMQTLAFHAVGATVGGPLYADVCRSIPSAQLQTLLTLDAATLTPDPADLGSMTKCSLTLKTATDTTAGSITLEVRHHQTPAQFDTGQGFEPQTLVQTNDPHDRVLVPPGTRGRATAMHGTTIATIDVEGPDAYAIVSPSYAYRVQRAALQAAGATIVPTSQYGPDPVAKGITTPPPPTLLGRITDRLGSLIGPGGLGILLPILVFGSIGIMALRRRFQRNRLLSVGQPATARIDSVGDTGTTINNRPMVRFNLTIQPQNGQPYQATTTKLVSRLQSPASLIGTTRPVLVDPADPQSFVFKDNF